MKPLLWNRINRLLRTRPAPMTVTEIVRALNFQRTPVMTSLQAVRASLVAAERRGLAKRIGHDPAHWALTFGETSEPT